MTNVSRLKKKFLLNIFGILIIFYISFLYDDSIWMYLKSLRLEFYWGQIIRRFLYLVVGIIGFAAILLPAYCNSIFKWGMFIIFSISILTYQTYFFSSGVRLDYFSWSLIWNARANFGDAIAQYRIPLLKSLFPVGLLLISYLLISFSKKKIWPFALASFIVSISVFSILCIRSKGNPRPIFPTATSLYGLMGSQLFDNKNIVLTYTTARLPDKKPSAKNIVLVIDESIRSDIFHKMVLEDTTIKRGIWNIYDFGIATSMVNCSSMSNLMLRKLVTSTDSITQELINNPLVWSLAHNAGFKTWLLDGQRGGFGHDHFDQTERNLIDYIPNVLPLDDSYLVDTLKTIWKDGNSFAIIIKKGAHFPYSKNYPKNFQSHSKVLLNPYIKGNKNRIEDVNAIDFQTRNFIKALLNTTPKNNTVVFYTSDHGQNIFDFNALTHCNSVAGSIHQEEGIVPLIVFSNFNIDGMDTATSRNKDKMSHFELVGSIKDFLGYSIKNQRNLLEDTSWSPVPGFYYKNFFGSFHSTPELFPVDRAAFKRSEIERWGSE